MAGGRGRGTVCIIAEISLLNEAITVDDKESFLPHGNCFASIMGGSSTGLLRGVARWCRA